ncbi:SPOR domain-containing protein [Comamonas granuli]|uniref:SPOR domain-containing protein n=1 Tax=Comamonas granuli TaxID=290309 RepID=UPI0005A8AFF2|nr:SPOR domain-containing protein [Comamonas granuli]
MLRFAVIVLLLANAGYFAWSQGHLAAWGLAPEPTGEPQRLQQQIRPEAVRLAGVPASAPQPAPAPAAAAAPEPAAAEASSPAPAPQAAAEPARAAGECLQAGIFDETQAEALRRSAATALPQGSWSLERTSIPGRWMVYMGKFADAEALAKKRAELRELGVSYDRPGSATFEPGLSLGRFSTEEAAQRGLGNLTAKGVRSARVVQERADAPGYLLRLPAVDEAQRARLPALRSALAGKTLKPCS